MSYPKSVPVTIPYDAVAASVWPFAGSEDEWTDFDADDLDAGVDPDFDEMDY